MDKAGIAHRRWENGCVCSRGYCGGPIHSSVYKKALAFFGISHGVYGVEIVVFFSFYLCFLVWISLLFDVFDDVVNDGAGVGVVFDILFNFPYRVDDGSVVFPAEYLPDFG